MDCVKAKFYLASVYPTAEEEQEEADEDKEEEEDNNDLPSHIIKPTTCSGGLPEGQQLVESESEESQSLLAKILFFSQVSIIKFSKSCKVAGVAEVARGVGISNFRKVAKLQELQKLQGVLEFQFFKKLQELQKL